MVGAAPDLFAKVEPLIRHFATEVTNCGGIGAGQVTKILNNMVLFQTVNALAEAAAIARRSGVEPKLLFETLSKGSADSFALRNHGLKAMIPGEFPERAFSTEYALKDLSYALDLARDVELVDAGRGARGQRAAGGDRQRLRRGLLAGDREGCRQADDVPDAGRMGEEPMVSQGVAAVDRALTILRAFEGEGDPEPLTLAALARRTGLYKSTMLRLMVSLQAFGYIVQLPDGRYHLGPTPFRLGSVYQRGNRLYDHVMPVLRALVAQGTESPSFHIRHDAKLRLCVLRIDSQHSTLDRVCAGALLPLDRGAAGTIILAFDGAQRGEKYDRRAQACSAISYGERDPDCAGIASPVFGADDKLVGALSVSGPKSRFTDESVRKMSAQVIDAARRVTYSLGGRHPV